MVKRVSIQLKSSVDMAHEKDRLLLYYSSVSTKSRKQDGLLLSIVDFNRALLCNLTTREEVENQKYS
jgi:hypothetical protein